MKVNWLIESDVFGDDVKRLVQSVKDAGHNAVVWASKEWCNYDIASLFDKRDCVVYYGSLGTSYRVAREAPWVPGMYSTLSNYRCSYYYPKLHRWLLNSPAVFIPFGLLKPYKDALFDMVGEEDCLFVRPDAGTKVFTGKMLERERFEKDVEYLGFYDPAPDEMIVVAPPKNVVKEWRFVVVDNRIITGSLYRDGLNPFGQDLRRRIDLNIVTESFKDIDHNDDANAVAVANCVLNQCDYQPDRAWTLDICKTRQGDFSVLEVGCFSCAGLYQCDTDVIVKEVSRVAIEDHQEVFGK